MPACLPGSAFSVDQGDVLASSHMCVHVCIFIHMYILHTYAYIIYVRVLKGEEYWFDSYMPHKGLGVCPCIQHLHTMLGL